MSTRKLSAVFGLAAVGSMLLSACGSNATPIVVTAPPVIVKETVVSIQKEQSTVIVTQAAPATATPVPEWTRPHPILADVKVRQGIAHCTDRDKLIASVYEYVPDADKPKLRMDTWMPKTSQFYAANNPNIVDYPFDKAKGGALLEAAGWKLAEKATVRANAKNEPLTLRFTTTNAQFRQTWGAVFTKQMADCGIVLQPSYIPGTIWFGAASGLARRDFDLGGFAWVGQSDPGGTTLYACDQIPTPANNWAGQNYMGWCNKKASDAVRAANNTLSIDERKKQYAIVQEEFTKDMISLPLFQRAETAGYNKNLKGIKFNTTYYYTASSAQWELPGKDTVVIALTQEPSSMYSAAESAAVQRIAALLVLGASYTQYDYGYQPVTYAGDKLPTIENGGTKKNEVALAEGMRIVAADGNPYDFKGGKLIDLKGKESTSLKVVDSTGATVDAKVGVKLPQLVVTVQGKPDKWSDGEKVVKADLELGYKINCDKTGGRVSYDDCDRTAKVEFPNDDTSIVTYVPGYLSPLYFLAGYGAYPSHQVIKSKGPYEGKKLSEVAAKDFATLPEIAETPLGTGPYVMTKWEKGQRMIFEANKNYILGEPKVKRVIIQFFGDTNGAVAALLAGTVDIVGSETLGAGAEAKTVFDAAKAGKVASENIASSTWEHIDFNLNSR